MPVFLSKFPYPLNYMDSGNGDIHLYNISAIENDRDGALFSSDNVESIVSMTGTNFFNNNGYLDPYEYGIGLIIPTSGNIDVHNVYADGNHSVGVYLRSDSNIELHNVFANGNNEVGVVVLGFGDGNSYSSLGNIHVSQSETGVSVNNFGDGNSFLGNIHVSQSETGAFVYHGGNGDVYLENLDVSDVGWNGVEVWLWGSGNVFVSGLNTFEDMYGDAIKIVSNGDIHAENLNTNRTGGIHLETLDGSVFLTGSNYFNNTIYQGHVVFIEAVGDVFVDGVTSINGAGGSGIKIGATGTVTISCSLSANNRAYGLEVGFDDWRTHAPTYYPDTVILNNVSFSNNGSGDHLIIADNLVVNPAYPCGFAEEDESLADVFSRPLPFQVVSLNDTGTVAPVPIDCALYRGLVLVLPNGDSVTYHCPLSGLASLNGYAEGQLPDGMPAGYTFISGLRSDLANASFLIEDGVVTFSFVAPVDLTSGLTILYWDGAAWVDLSTAAFVDGKIVYDGGVKINDGKIQVSTNFTGIFVLARK
jgi:hypothetical protein